MSPSGGCHFSPTTRLSFFYCVLILLVNLSIVILFTYKQVEPFLLRFDLFFDFASNNS